MTWRVAANSHAATQIARIDRWWRKHRRAAPDLFRDELAAAEEQLKFAAHSGVRVRDRGQAETRRLLLPRTRYHVYYRVTDDVVTLLAVWASTRGRTPKLR